MPIHMMIGTKGFGMATRKKRMIFFTIIPTPEFQISHYKEREYVRSECEKNDIPCIINDGLISKDEMFEKDKKESQYQPI